MNNDNTITFVQACIVAVVAAIAVGIVLLTFQKPENTNQAAGASPAGSTFSSAKYAGITFSLASATSTTIVNTDSNDRYIIAMETVCTGIGTSQTAYTGAGLTSVGLLFKASTSTQTTAGAAQNITNTTSLAFSTFIATTTPGGLYSISSSTLALASLPAFEIWPAGTGLTMFTNATNTAVCTGGVRYIGS